MGDCGGRRQATGQDAVMYGRGGRVLAAVLGGTGPTVNVKRSAMLRQISLRRGYRINFKRSGKACACPSLTFFDMHIRFQRNNVGGSKCLLHCRARCPLISHPRSPSLALSLVVRDLHWAGPPALGPRTASCYPFKACHSGPSETTHSLSRPERSRSVLIPNNTQHPDSRTWLEGFCSDYSAVGH